MLAKREQVNDSEGILQDLLGTICAGCGGKKASRMSHCRNCYFALPEHMRKALYRRFGSGYEEAFRSSTRFLKERHHAANK